VRFQVPTAASLWVIYIIATRQIIRLCNLFETLKFCMHPNTVQKDVRVDTEWLQAIT
jgi:hypothetical protein